VCVALVIENCRFGNEVLFLNHRLIIPTLPGYRDAFRTTVTENDARAVLFYPRDERYVSSNGVLFCGGEAVTWEQLFEQISNPAVNRPIEEPVLVYGLFSFMYTHGDLRNHVAIQTTESRLCRFLGVSSGVNGFRLIEKMWQFRYVFGVIHNLGVFPLLNLEVGLDGTVVLRSDFFHHLLNLMIAERIRYGQNGRFYSKSVYADLVAARNKPAAMIVIELARLIAICGQRGHPHISLGELAYRIPQLAEIWRTPKETSFQNRKLRRAFEPVEKLLTEKTSLMEEFDNLRIHVPELSVSKPKAVMRITHRGYKGAS